MPTFAELKTAVSKRLLDANNTAVSSADVGDSINAAIRYWKQRTFWFNQKNQTVTLNIDNPIIPNFPIDFLYEIPEGGFVIDYSQTRWPLTKVDNATYENANVEGKGLPYLITFREGTWQVYWYPDQEYSLIIRYIKDYNDLVGDNDVNDFTTFADRLIMYDALSRLNAEFRQDEKMESYYSARAGNEYKNLNQRSNKVYGTGTMQIEQ